MGQASFEFADIGVSSASLSLPVGESVLAIAFVTGGNIRVENLAR
jgi:hypothetical protein